MSEISSLQCAINKKKEKKRNLKKIFFRFFFQLLKLIAHCEDQIFTQVSSTVHIYDFFIYSYSVMLIFAYDIIRHSAA